MRDCDLGGVGSGVVIPRKWLKFIKKLNLVCSVTQFDKRMAGVIFATFGLSGYSADLCRQISGCRFPANGVSNKLLESPVFARGNR